MERRFAFDRLLGRYRIFIVLAAAVFGVILIRLFALQVVRGESYIEQAQKNRIRPEILRAHRGRILDREGRVLADNAPSFDLLFDPRDRSFRRNPERRAAVVGELARVLDAEKAVLLERVERARRLGLPPLTLARNLGFATLSVLEERMEHLPGVEIRPQAARRYPFGRLASHLIGHLGEVSEADLEAPARSSERPYRPGDLLGRTGIERAYETNLRGIDGVEYVGVDALGRRTNLFEELPSLPSMRGDDLILTIDLDLQRAAETALDSLPAVLARAGDGERRERPASVVALDPRTGEVLVMASRPDYDPNLFVTGLTQEGWRLLSRGAHPLLNRATQSSYPPASTFKLLTALAGLEQAGLLPEEKMPQACFGGYRFGNRRFGCWRAQGHGAMALRSAIVQSCDVYFYQLGLRLGTERMMNFAVSCSLGVRTRIDLPQERASLIPTATWYRRVQGHAPYPGAALNLSIGQGELLLTPLALARFYAAVVNDGMIRRPHVVTEIRSRQGEARRSFESSTASTGRLPVSRRNLVILRDALEGVVMDERGTGKRARVGEFRIGGKTGTAENPHGEDHAVFVGYAPAESPEIVVAVVVERSGHGGSVAAPIAQRVFDAYLNPTKRPIAEAIAP